VVLPVLLVAMNGCQKVCVADETQIRYDRLGPVTQTGSHDGVPDRITVAIADRPDEPAMTPPTPPARLPLSGADGPAGDAAAAVRSMLDGQMLDQLVARMRTDGVRLSGPGGFLTEMVKAVLDRTYLIFDGEAAR